MRSPRQPRRPMRCGSTRNHTTPRRPATITLRSGCAMNSPLRVSTPRLRPSPTTCRFMSKPDSKNSNIRTGSNTNSVRCRFRRIPTARGMMPDRRSTPGAQAALRSPTSSMPEAGWKAIIKHSRQRASTSARASRSFATARNFVATSPSARKITAQAASSSSMIRPRRPARVVVPLIPMVRIVRWARCNAAH